MEENKSSWTLIFSHWLYSFYIVRLSECDGDDSASLLSPKEDTKSNNAAVQPSPQKPIKKEVITTEDQDIPVHIKHICTRPNAQFVQIRTCHSQADVHYNITHRCSRRVRRFPVVLLPLPPPPPPPPPPVLCRLDWLCRRVLPLGRPYASVCERVRSISLRIICLQRSTKTSSTFARRRALVS